MLQQEGPAVERATERESRIERLFGLDKLLMEAGPGATKEIGSARLEEIYTAPDGSYQIIELKARDGSMDAMPAHAHKGIQITYVLRGYAFVNEELIQEGDVHTIPAGMRHKFTPSPEAWMLLVFVPAEAVYNSGRNNDPG